MMKINSITMQHTVNTPILISGHGLHSGAKADIVIHPAIANSGLRFIKQDGSIIIPLYSNVRDTSLCTAVFNESGSCVKTIEHLMAALWYLGIDNVDININSDEMPILDGSAIEFIRLIQATGIAKQETKRKVLQLKRNIKIEKDGRVIEALPFNNLCVDYTIVYKEAAIGTQHFIFDESINDFLTDIGLCRTFGLVSEFEYLKSKGLARGASLENAIGIDGERVINPDGLRVPLEPVRHKILDCIGDLYTSGYRINAKIVCFKAGHHMHNELLKAIFDNDDNYEII